MDTRNHPIKKAINEQVAFLKWAEVDLSQFFIQPDVKRCWISPDVRSMHILWMDNDQRLWHEIADYDSQDWDDATAAPSMFLESEIGDDCQGEVHMDLWDVFNDYSSGYSEDNPPPMFDVNKADEAFAKHVRSWDLFAALKGIGSETAENGR